MPIYKITSDKLQKIEETSFSVAGIRERADLQRMLKNQIGIIDPDIMIIAEEFGEWEESQRRIDLLAIDKSANLVVIELKRTEDGGHMELQALRYAAMVSAMTFSKAVDTYANYLAKINEEKDAHQALLTFLDWEESNDDAFAQDVRIILASAEFSKEVTTTVLWLNTYGLDIRCVRLKPYNNNGQTLIDVEQVIPLPETSDYIEKIGNKSRQERINRTSKKDLTKFNITINGNTVLNLAKRNAIFHIVKYLCESKIKPEKIAGLIFWRSHRVFVVLDGHLSHEDFISTATKQYLASKKVFEERRWFCDENELIYSENKTYAFSNQWGIQWAQAMNILIDAFPEAQISYYANKAE